MTTMKDNSSHVADKTKTQMHKSTNTIKSGVQAPKGKVNSAKEKMTAKHTK